MISGHKKVHIVPVAFEVDRAVLPVLENGADTVYVLWGADENHKTSPYPEKVRRRLEKRIPKVVSVNFGFYDYPSIFSKLVEIGRTEQGNDVLINLSSGGHIVSIAGTLAASMFGWTPYYVEPQKYHIDHTGPISSGVKRVFEIQTYPVEKPKDGLVKCLKVLEGIGSGSTSQKALLERLERAGMISISKEGGSVAKKTMMDFRRKFLEPLLDKGWISKEGKGKSSRIEITDNGKEIAKVFG